jgi:hypothetical protein
MKKKKPLRSKKNTQKKKIRKVNQYNQIRSKASKYCKEKYGRRCTNKELNDAYRAIKKEDIKNNKQFINKVFKKIDSFFDVSSKKDIPSELVGGVNWFDLESMLASKESNKFFKDDDEIIIGLDEVGKKDKVIKFKDFKKKYRKDIYPLLREYAGKESPIPILDLDLKESDLNKRKFIFDLKDEDKDRPRIIEQRKVKKDDEDKKVTDNEVELAKERTKALDLLRKDFEDGIFTKKEYKEERKRIFDRYNQGGLL